MAPLPGSKVLSVPDRLKASPRECLGHSYVRLYHIPPSPEGTPRDCTKVFFTESPELTLIKDKMNDPQPGFDFLCAVPTLAGAGGVLLLLQASAYVKWQISFIDTSGRPVKDWHRVFVSVPLMTKLEGPRMALTAVVPWQVKLLLYANIIVHAFARRWRRSFV